MLVVTKLWEKWNNIGNFNIILYIDDIDDYLDYKIEYNITK